MACIALYPTDASILRLKMEVRKVKSIEEDAGQKLQELGREIRARRKSLGWSQEKLCEEADVSVYTVKRVEAGTNIWAIFLIQILTALGMATATPAPVAPDLQQIKAELQRLVDLL